MKFTQMCSPPKWQRVVIKILTLAGVWTLLVVFDSAQTGWADVSGRRDESLVTGVVNTWEMKAWKDNALLCEIFVEHDEFPTDEEIETYCGTNQYQEWANAPPCNAILQGGNPSACAGGYLTHMGKYEREYRKIVYLPEAEAHFELTNCAMGEWCEQKPKLHIYGLEPLPEYEIQEVHLQAGTRTVTCQRGEDCYIQLPTSPVEGSWIDYWVNSSYGDQSPRKTIHMRNLYQNQDGGQYFFEILSLETTNNYTSAIWDAFPTLDHPDEVLFEHDILAQQIFTDHKLYYLAGKLIYTGQIDASECLNSGLLPNGMASACGEEQAHRASLTWQNQYNAQIAEAAQRHTLPPRIIKGIITQESQFWYDTGIESEYGIGCLAEEGIDLLLNWDTSSFLSLCVPQYGESICASGYAKLGQGQRAYLRGLALQVVGTDEEIDLLTRVIGASATQVGQMVQNTTGQTPGLVSTYEDLWSLAIANYHVGSGCISEGIQYLESNNLEITFENFCTVSADCPTACVFVEQVKAYARDSTEHQ